MPTAHHLFTGVGWSGIREGEVGCLGEESHLSFSLSWSNGRSLCVISDNKRYHKRDNALSRF